MTPLEDWPRWKYAAMVAGSLAAATAWAWSFASPREPQPQPTRHTLGTIVVPATVAPAVETTP